MAEIIWGTIIISSFVLLFCFIAKELWRNGNRSEWKEIINKNSRKNLNDLLGITKTTFLTIIVNLIILSIAYLSLLETSNQSKVTADVNSRTTQILQSMLDRLEK